MLPHSLAFMTPSILLRTTTPPLRNEFVRNGKLQCTRVSCSMESLSATSKISRRASLGLILAAPASVLAQQVTAEQQAEALAAESIGQTPIVDPSKICDQALSYLVNKETGQKVYLIGTAHISSLSADLVQATIRKVVPDTVMIELDESRIKRSIGPQREERQPQSVWQLLRAEFAKPGVSFADKIKNVESGLIGMAIGGLYQKLNKMGFSSGQEFKVAVDEARAINANLVLGDRRVDETLSRLQEAFDKSGWQAVQKFVTSQGSDPSELSFLQKETTTSDDVEALSATVEALKERSTVREIMAGLKEGLPEVYTALIAERDQYMANSILKANGKSTVAVVGMAHMDGIEKALEGFEIAPCTL